MIYQLGRLVKDIELKEIEIGGKKKLVLNNSLAIKIDKDNTSFIDITAWGGIAESIIQFFHKGDEILIKGEIRNKKSKVEEKEITAVFVLVAGFEFTYGNKRNDNCSEDIAAEY